MKKFWGDILSALWLRPAIWAAVLSLVAIVLVTLERRVGTGDPASLPWPLTSGVDVAISQINIISTLVISAVTIVFSITIIAVNQAANAYSPRILDQYLRDTANHHVMGILIGTFLFNLFTLRGIDSTQGEEFVPTIATNVVLLLSILSLGAFIYFLNHVGDSIKVNSAIDLILSRTRKLVRAPYPHEAAVAWSGELPDDPRWPATPPDATSDVKRHVVTSERSGYLRLLDVQQLFRAACAADGVAWLHHRVGDYVLPETPLITLCPASGLTKQVAQQAAKSITLSAQQTMEQDALFGIRQISDIALRAISPGINDPSTALNCIDALSTLLFHWHHHADVRPHRADASGRLRLVLPYPDFDEAFAVAFSQIRHYGKSDLAVTTHLLNATARLARHIADEDVRATLWNFVSETAVSAADNVQQPADRQRINRCLHQVADVFGKDVHHLLLSTTD